MSWKSIACIAALGAFAAPALAVPTLSITKTATTFTVNVVNGTLGSMGAELRIDTTGLTLSNPVLANSVVWDFVASQPGANTIPGAPAITNGIYAANIAAGDLFISAGSDVVGAGTYPLLTVNYTGTGSATVTGNVAQLGLLNPPLSLTESIGAAPAVPGDANGDGKVNSADFSILAGNWLANPAPAPGGAAVGDFNVSGNVNSADFSILAGNWLFGTSTSSAVAVPEPTTMLMAGLALVAGVSRRRV